MKWDMRTHRVGVLEYGGVEPLIITYNLAAELQRLGWAVRAKTVIITVSLNRFTQP